MKKLQLTFTFIIAILSFAFFANAADPKIEQNAKRVEAAIKAVPADASVFAYQKPTPNASIIFDDPNVKEGLASIKNNAEINKAVDKTLERDKDEFIASLLSIFVQKGGFASLIDSYIDLATTCGYVAYVDKIDGQKIMEEETIPNFALVAFFDTKKAKEAIDKLIAEKKEDVDIKISEAETKNSGKLSLYTFNLDEGYSLVFSFTPDSFLLADSAATLVSFSDAMAKPAATSILDNAEYKKLSAKTKAPIMGVFANFYSISLPVEGKMSMMMMEGFLDLSKVNSMAIFTEDYTSKNDFNFKFLVSADKGSFFNELFAGKLLKKDGLKFSSNKDSFASMAFAVPSDSKRIMDTLEAIPTPEAVMVASFIKELKQLNYSVKDVNGDVPEMTIQALVANADTCLQNPMLAIASASEAAPAKLSDTSLAISTFESADDIKAREEGKSPSFEIDPLVKNLSDKIGDGNAYEFYFNNTKYFDIFAQMMDDMNDNESLKFMAEFKDSIKYYLIAGGIKSEEDVIVTNAYLSIDADYKKIFDAYAKLITSFEKDREEKIKIVEE